MSSAVETWHKLLEEKQITLDCLRPLKKTLEENNSSADGFYQAYYQHHLDYYSPCHSQTLYEDDALFFANKELTVLGREKVLEIFNRFIQYQMDTAPLGDIGWTYDTFRIFLSRVRRLQVETWIDNREMWKMVVSDRYELNDHGLMTYEGLVRYYWFKEMHVDTKNTLANDLVALDIAWISKMQQVHCTLRKLFQQYDVDGTGVLDSRDLRMFIYEGLGHVMTEEETNECVQMHIEKQKVMYDIRKVKRALRLYGCFQHTDRSEHDSPLQMHLLCAWLLAKPNLYTHETLQQYGLVAKCAIYRKWRTIVNWGYKKLFWMRKAASYGMFAESVLESRRSKVVDTKGNYEAKFHIGVPKPEEMMRSRIDILYRTELDAEGTLHELQYGSKPGGAYIFIDFACVNKSTDVKRAQEAMHDYIERHFLQHFKLLPCFQDWLITSFKESRKDNWIVLRIALLFSYEADINNLFELLAIPRTCTIENLLSGFDASLNCSISLADLFISKRLNINEQLSISGDISIELDRYWFATLLEQTNYQWKQKLDADDLREQAYQRQSIKPVSDRMHHWSQVKRQKNGQYRRKLMRFYAWVCDFCYQSKSIQLQWDFPSWVALFHDSPWLRQIIPRHLHSILNAAITKNGGLASHVHAWTKFCIQKLCTFAEDENMNDDTRTFLKIYHESKSSIQSLHQIRVVSGSVGLTFNCKGINFPDIFPKPGYKRPA